MKTTYHWQLIPLETPKPEKKCSRCPNNQFQCSEKFRINSNKKMTDVWLIYKCTQCQSTWNMDIIVRKNISNIDHDLFEKFQENCVALAWQYAFNKNILGNNKVQVNWNIPFSLNGCIQDILSQDNNITLFIQSEYELGIPIRKVMQKIFPFSHKQLELMVANGDIIVNSNPKQALAKKIGVSCKIEFNYKDIFS